MRKAARFSFVAFVLLASCGAPTTAAKGPSFGPVATGARAATPLGIGGKGSASPQPSFEPSPGPPVASGSRTNPPPSGTTMPDGRGAAQVAYDTTLHELVLFGGDGPGGPIGDTWTWKSGHWSWMQTDIAPSERALGAFVYDPVRHVSVLFGGAPPGGWVSSPLNDTWTFDGNHWTRQIPSSSPSPRSGAGVTFDTRRGVVVLMGGYSGQTFLNDVWTWDGTNWTQQASSLPGMYPAGIGYRSVDDSILLVGQTNPGVSTWTYSQQSWRQVTGSGAPECLDLYGGSAEDEQRGVLVFFGGYCPNTTVVWDGSAWSSSTPTPSPVARGNEAGRPAMTYDPDQQVVLLFGGVANGTYFNDLWAWDGGKWANIG